MFTSSNDLQLICEVYGFKARLIVRGFQMEQGVDFDDSFSPTPGLAVGRFRLSLAVATITSCMRAILSKRACQLTSEKHTKLLTYVACLTIATAVSFIIGIVSVVEFRADRTMRSASYVPARDGKYHGTTVRGTV